MRKQYHILNGDALKQQFPENIKGDTIVSRECLVDGDVSGETIDELFASRAKFLSQSYGGTEQDYYDKSEPEFRKMLEIDANADINLWFEDDLFCQVNFWFVVNLLMKCKKHNRLFLVRPKTQNYKGFGGLRKPELISIYEKRVSVTELNKISSLWELYQSDSTQELMDTASELNREYPFILAAVNAHIQRIPENGNMGRPTRSLITIIEELKTEEFGPIFKEFNKRESIYGFGDLQVRRLYNDIMNNR